MIYTRKLRSASIVLAPALLLIAVPIGCGPKTEQAVGTGMVGVGAAIATVEPATGVAIAAGGAALATHGAYREEIGGSR